MLSTFYVIKLFELFAADAYSMCLQENTREFVFRLLQSTIITTVIMGNSVF